MFLLDITIITLGWWQLIAAGFGIIIGSFLNVYIYRFHTGKSLSGHSHCLSCGERLRWFDLFPLVSYLILRGRCRDCGCKISPRYFLVELFTGLLFAATLWLTTGLLEIFLYWWLFSILVVITVYDLYHFIIPDKMTIILTCLLFAQMIYGYIQHPAFAGQVFVYIGAALGGSAFFFSLWWYSKGLWIGFGDVKLAFPLGLMVGPSAVFSFVVLAFWIGAVLGLLILGYFKLQKRMAGLQLLSDTLTMKSAVPFAPFLIISSLVVLFTRFNVLDLFSFV